jgi:type II secretory pathway pseudopilin PulG
LAHRLTRPLLSRAPARARTAALVVVAVLATTAGGTTLAWSTAADEAQRKVERKAEQAARKAGRTADQSRPPAVPEVAFTCDPAKTHGQNVSAYARSLPQGPGRGRQVSQAARSDCGKPVRGSR